MAGIFISYRHVDVDNAFLLQYWLKEHFGQSLVFFDKQDIGPGEDWPTVIQKRVRSSSALIALIGGGWVEARNRLDDPDDWVNAEIATALALDILVVPVLTSTVGNLLPDALPEDMKDLAAKQSLSMVESNFHSRLMQALQKVVPAGDRVDLESLLDRVRDLMLRQLTRLQSRAVRLIMESHVDLAVEELQEGSSLMMELIQLAPQGLHIDADLGYQYKALAQAFDAAGDQTQADHYLDLAFGAFQRVRDTGGADVADIASALNGMGNVYHARDRLEKAVRYYRLAVEVEPRYAYAWHDLFISTEAMARKGAIDLETMRESLAKVIETGTGLPGLGKDEIGIMRSSLGRWEASTEEPKPKKSSAVSREAQPKSKRRSTPKHKPKRKQ